MEPFDPEKISWFMLYLIFLMTTALVMLLALVLMLAYKLNRVVSKLNDISEQMRELGVNAAPGQVASMLLRYSLDSTPRKYRVSDGQADDVEEMADRILAAAASAGVSLTGMRPVAVELLRQMLSEKRNESGNG